jgi:hypothetical protein
VDHHTVSNCTYIVSQWITTLSLTIYVQLETVWLSSVILYMYSQRQCDDPLWYYICTVRDSVMIHCDTIYVQLETVWWSTVILYMYSQRQCDDPLWYYICTVRDSVMIHCDTIYVQLETVWWATVILLYIYSITVDHHTVSNCTYIVSQWITTLSLTVHI